MANALSQPLLKMDNERIYIVPNSLKYTLGEGEYKVRSAQSGTSAVPVSSVDAETKIGKCSFEVYSTDYGISDIKKWKKKLGSIAVEIMFPETGSSYISSQGSITSDPEIEISADGKISVEYQGSTFK